MVLAALVIGAIVCVLAGAPYPAFELDRHSIPKELTLHVTALIGAVLVLAPARRLPVTAVDAALAAYLGLSALSALAATNHWLAARGLAVSVSGAAIFWSARTIARAGWGHRLLWGLVAAVTIGALTALLQAYAGITVFSGAARAPGGSFGNRNFMAHLVALGLPLLIPAVTKAASRRALGLTLAAATIAGTALVLSRSRAAWLAASMAMTFAIVVGAWVWDLRRDRALRRRLAALGGALALGVAAALLLPNRLSWRSDSPYLESLRGVTNYRDGSGRGRLIQYRNTLGMVRDDPLLGVGPGNWPVAYPKYTTPGDPAYESAAAMPTNPWPSSDWVAALAERGVPAFAALVAVGLSLLVAAMRIARPATPIAATDRIALGALVLTACVIGTFDALFLLAAPTLVFWAAAGALLPARPPIQTIELTPRRRGYALAMIGVLGGAVVLRSALQVGAMRRYTDARTLRDYEAAAQVDPGNYRIRLQLAGSWISRGRCDLALPHAEAAAALFPSLPTPQRYLRTCARRRS